MTKHKRNPGIEEIAMKSYVFKVVFENDKWPDEPNDKAIWRAYVPALPSAHAWGDTQQEALENLQNAVELILEDMQERQEQIPLDAVEQISDQPLLTVTV